MQERKKSEETAKYCISENSYSIKNIFLETFAIFLVRRSVSIAIAVKNVYIFTKLIVYGVWDILTL